MVCKVRINCYTIFIWLYMNPVGNILYKSVTLFKYKYIRCYLCSCICLKCSIRKSHSTKQLCSFGKVFTDRFVLFIHSTFRGNKGNHASRSYFIQGFRKEIVMDQEIMLIELLVGNLILSEWYISYSNIKKVVRILCFLETLNLYFSIRV